MCLCLTLLLSFFHFLIFDFFPVKWLKLCEWLVLCTLYHFLKYRF
nr:MAG TPA: hypothetical protein [Caudoviricetes sp.]